MASGPTFYPGREQIKTSEDAPKLAIGIPTRGVAPIEFYMSLLQLVMPLNVKLTWCIKKSRAEKGDESLPAAVRNSIIEDCIAQGMQYVFFLDDDMLFPDLTLYRLWVTMQKHPEAAVVTGVYTTKVEPVEPEIYTDGGSGAYWDWPLGALVPIHSAGAGCFLVNLEYAKKLTPPYFNEVLTGQDDSEHGHHVRRVWGQDRWFMMRLRDEAGGQVYADTGLLLGHFDWKANKSYILPPTAPCFQREPVGEAYITHIDPSGVIGWSRIGGPKSTPGYEQFRGYIDWLTERVPDPEMRIALLGPIR